MYVYVIAPSELGPCKIGIAADPKKRLRALQTGSPSPLTLFGYEPATHSPRAVEHGVHIALKSRRSRQGGEWFDVSTREAHSVIRGVAASLEVLIDDGASLHELCQRAGLSWLAEQERLSDAAAETDEEYDMSDVRPPDILQLLAAKCVPPKSRFTFNDYLLTCGDGMWIRWAFERMDRKMPRGNQLAPYVEAERFLKSRGTVHGNKVASRWVEWSAGRELCDEEVCKLVEIWNAFAPAHNKVMSEGLQWDTAGIDDHVDDVHLYALDGDETRGDNNYIVFAHERFEVILVPERRIKLSSLYGDLRQIDKVRLAGFVTPVFSSKIWDVPFLPWLQNAPDQSQKTLTNFLENKQRRFPVSREYEGPQRATIVRSSLPSIDKYGFC